MKNKIYIGEGQGQKELKQAWQDCHGRSIPDELLQEMVAQPKGKITWVGKQDHDDVYWVAVGSSKRICKQAWADFLPLLDDDIANWEWIGW